MNCLERPILKASESIRFNNQGTLFALTPPEVDELADAIGENDLQAAELLIEETLGRLSWSTFHPSYAPKVLLAGFVPSTLVRAASG